MSRDKLGSKQLIVLQNYLFQNERYDFVFTPRRQSVGYIKLKRQTGKKAIIAKRKHLMKRRFSKTRNALSEFDKTTKGKLQDNKDSIDKKTQYTNKNVFQTQNPQHHHR